MNIKIKQRDTSDCGAACLASIAAYYKLKIPVSRIRQWAGTDKKGTSAWGIIKAAEKLGMSAKGVKAIPEALPEIPMPAIAHIIKDGQFMHYVVIYRVSKNYIKIMDPGTGTLSKELIETFKIDWTGVLILLHPSPDFVARNENISNFRRFWYLLKPHWKMLIQGLIGALIFTILGLSTAIYIQKVTDHVLMNGNTNLLNLLSVIMLMIMLVQVLIGSMQSVFILKTGQLIDSRLILGYYKFLLKLPQSFFDTMRTGEIVSRINDAVKIRYFINDTLLSVIVNLFIVLFAFVLMFFYNWQLALIMLLIIPGYALIYVITNKLNKKCERKIMEQAAELESQLVESIHSIRSIKQFEIEDFAYEKNEIRFIDLLYSVYKSGLNSLFSSNASFFLSRLFTIILLWTGSRFVLQHEITPGELMSFYALIGYFTSPVNELIGMNKIYQNATIAADRLFEIMDLESEEEEGEDGLVIKKNLKGDIAFRNVSFSYGTRDNIFEKLNLTIKEQEITAIVGESGSGKTTIASLLQRLYLVNSGGIFIGDTNINYLNKQNLRQTVGIVPQELDLFTGTVAENIALGEFQQDSEKLIRICKQLDILEFIEAMPHGFQTYLGEYGTTLSGGQKQRIAIARLLYRDPSIFIFDEATSSLDSEAEMYVQKIIHQLKNEKKTIILIAHRLGTLVNADKIIVLKNGQIMEEGSHQELWDKKDLYFSMWKNQIPLLERSLSSI